MSKTNCFSLIERTVLNSDAIPTVKVFGARGTLLFEGSAMEVPFRVCWHTVESYDFVKHTLYIRLK